MTTFSREEMREIQEKLLQMKKNLYIANLTLYMFRIALTTMVTLSIVDHYPSLNTWYWYIIIAAGSFSIFSFVFSVFAVFFADLYINMKKDVPEK